ncbi:alpha/beta hydrolase [Inquilinus limosus]|uniref:alpha/beta fold hydrolase n=1 Tax=Inquilinus limosus TaxID=171674 RepID=UPI003F17556E
MTVERLRTPHLEIAYETAGPADGPPVVLVHGWPDDVRCWDEVTPQLAKAGCRIFAPYLRGCGPTRFLSADTMRSGAIAALGQDLADFLDGLDLRDVLVVGYDWGARAGYAVAALQPQRLRGLAAMSAGYATAKPIEEEFQASAASWDNPDWAAISIHAYLQRWGETPGAPEHEAAERRLAQAPKIAVPTVMLHGAEDRDNFPETSAGKEEFFLDAYERTVLPGIGHFLPREAPDEVVAAVRSLLSR